MKGYYKQEEESRQVFAHGWSTAATWVSRLGELPVFPGPQEGHDQNGRGKRASLEVEKTIYLDPRVQEVHVIGLPTSAGWKRSPPSSSSAGQTAEEKEIIACARRRWWGSRCPSGSSSCRTAAVGGGEGPEAKIREQYLDLYQGER
jgi:hypothetical protein